MSLTFREATIEDLPEIVRMLANDFLGKQRDRFEDPLPDSYVRAFREIEVDPNNELVVAVISDASASDADGIVRVPVVGTMQLTFTPSISFQGGRRCTIESVRVHEKLRGQGVGREMMLWAIERAKEKGCISMQLTTNNDRMDAHRFYANLGFSASHLGMKLKLK